LAASRDDRSTPGRRTRDGIALTNAESAAGEAAAALAVCRSCQVRSLCLALSLLHWDVGQHGVWGGLVAADRASLRRQMLARAGT
jgi:hypothetical protein